MTTAAGSWKAALAGAGLGPLAFAVFGGAWCLMTHSWSSPAFLSLLCVLALTLHGGAIVPAGIGVLIHALLGKAVSWTACPTGAILLASGISMLAWNAATTPLRFALSLQTAKAVSESGGKPEEVPTGWIFIGATVTGAVWGLVGGVRVWRRQSSRKRGDLTPDMALAIAVLCAALAVGVHTLFFGGPLYWRRFDP